jgi:hypothetical protein
VPEFADDHVETVGTEIDRRNNLRGRLPLYFVCGVIGGNDSSLNDRYSRVIASVVASLIALLGVAHGFRRRGGGRYGYTLNEEPQPQVVLALGFRMTNCAPCRSSL